MWKKSRFAEYKKVESNEEDSARENSFNYQKLKACQSETMPKHHRASQSSTYSNASTSSNSTSKQCPTQRYTSSQQSFAFVPPVFPVIPQKFVFFG